MMVTVSRPEPNDSIGTTFYSEGGVTKVVLFKEGSIGERCGLQQSDLIYEINDETVQGAKHAADIVARAGRTVAFLVGRSSITPSFRKTVTV